MIVWCFFLLKTDFKQISTLVNFHINALLRSYKIGTNKKQIPKKRYLAKLLLFCNFLTMHLYENLQECLFVWNIFLITKSPKHYKNTEKLSHNLQSKIQKGNFSKTSKPIILLFFVFFSKLLVDYRMINKTPEPFFFVFFLLQSHFGQIFFFIFNIFSILNNHIRSSI